MIVDQLGKIPPPVSKKLRQRGFKDAIDKLLLKVAIAIEDCVVTSGDSDFWDPQAPKSKCIGDHNAYVADLLHKKCGVLVLTLRQMIEKLE